MDNMDRLSLASAKHLLARGHLTQAHHDTIVKSVHAKQPKPPRRSFGAMAPQQAQAPIPGYAPPANVPAGTATGYGSDE